MVGKVEKIRPQFINKERGDADENISAKDRYKRECVCVFIDVIYSTRTTITTLLLQRLRPIVL